MSRLAQVRLPLDPLLDACGARRSVSENRHGHAGPPNPASHLAARVGVTRRSVCRWASEGGVPIDTADIAAVAIGRHPSEVWGDDWWAACREQDALEAEWRRARAEIVRGYDQVERHRDRMLAASERAAASSMRQVA